MCKNVPGGYGPAARTPPIGQTPYSLRLDPLLISLKGFEPFERLMREQTGK